MSDKREKKVYGSPVVASGFWVGLALFMIFFWGEPDLRGSLVEYLQEARYD